MPDHPHRSAPPPWTHPARGSDAGPATAKAPGTAGRAPSGFPVPDADVHAVLGAYASLPAGRADQEEYYRLLAEIPAVRGLELPYRNDLGGEAGLDWLAARLADHWDRCIVTGIPGTMARVRSAAAFGLASTSREGRRAALAFTRGMRNGIEALHEAAGRTVVAGVELHPAPSGAPERGRSARALGESLAELVDWDWGDAVLLIEHCDAYVSPDRGEKQMMSLDEELAVVTALAHPRVRMSLNWGRSALEARSADTARDHVARVRAAGVLEGVTFSGAGPVDTRYAAAWMDGHLPLDVDEPGSVMTAERVRECAWTAVGPDAAGAPPARYLGAKCQVPATARPAERADILRRILASTALL